MKFCLIFNVLFFLCINDSFANESGHGSHQHDAHAVKAHSPADSGLGPVIEAKVVFPVKGTYGIFSEVKHKGRVLLLDFMVDAE